MSRPARSLFVFGIYVIVVGLGLVALPRMLMSLLQLPPATVGWARVVGLLALVIGTYDVVGSRAECVPYIRSSVPVRYGFAIGTVLLVVVGEMPPTLIILGVIDAACATWTAISLRQEAVAGA